MKIAYDKWRKFLNEQLDPGASADPQDTESHVHDTEDERINQWNTRHIPAGFYDSELPTEKAVKSWDKTRDEWSKKDQGRASELYGSSYAMPDAKGSDGGSGYRSWNRFLTKEFLPGTSWEGREDDYYKEHILPQLTQRANPAATEAGLVHRAQGTTGIENSRVGPQTSFYQRTKGEPQISMAYGLQNPSHPTSRNAGGGGTEYVSPEETRRLSAYGDILRHEIGHGISDIDLYTGIGNEDRTKMWGASDTGAEPTVAPDLAGSAMGTMADFQLGKIKQLFPHIPTVGTDYGDPEWTAQYKAQRNAPHDERPEEIYAGLTYQRAQINRAVDLGLRDSREFTANDVRAMISSSEEVKGGTTFQANDLIRSLRKRALGDRGGSYDGAAKKMSDKEAKSIADQLNSIAKTSPQQASQPESMVAENLEKAVFDKWREFLKEEAITSTEVSLYLAPSPIHGEGVFTGKHMPEGTDLGIAHIKQSEGHEVTSLGKYHNHSATPNCANVLKGDKRHLVALRDIGPDEEITVDYTLQSDLEQPGDDWL